MSLCHGWEELAGAVGAQDTDGVLKRRYFILLLFLLLLLAGLIIVLLARLRSPPDPVYAGHTLTEWVESYATNRPMYPQFPPSETDKAILEIGTNGLPLLLEYIALRQPTVRQIQTYRTINTWAGKQVLAKKAPILFTGAMYALQVLGPKARSAIPALQKRLQDPRLENYAKWRILQALSHMGPDALPAFLAALTNGSPALRIQAARELPAFGTNAGPAVPFLRSLHETNAEAAAAIANALKSIGGSY